MVKKRRIAVTGGPGSGKTTILDGLITESLNATVVVKESSTFLMNSLMHGRDFQATHREVFQSLIYYWQKTKEEAAGLDAGARWLLCDRGTLDGAVYWPGGVAQFCDRLKTSVQSELDRYDAVIHLEVAGQADYERSLGTNSVRHETWSEAISLCEQGKEIWSQHPKFFCVPSTVDFTVKHASVKQILLSLMG